MALRDRVKKLEMTQGNSGTERQIYVLPGVQISIATNGVIFAIHNDKIAPAVFVRALLRERFPGVGGIILPCNHRHLSTCEQLGCPPEDREEENYT